MGSNWELNPSHDAIVTVALCFNTEHRPTMLELTDFLGKTRHFNTAVRIGRNYLSFDTGLLNDESGDVVPIYHCV